MDERLDEKTIDYLVEAILFNCPPGLILDREKLNLVLQGVSFKPPTTRETFSLTEEDIAISPEVTPENPNYQSGEAQEDAFYLALRRLLLNKISPKTYTWGERLLRGREEMAYRQGIITIDSNVICRHARTNQDIAHLLAESNQKGYLFSVLSIYGCYYHDGRSSLYIRKPILAIPGITNPKDLKKIRQFEEEHKRPPNTKIARIIRRMH